MLQKNGLGWAMTKTHDAVMPLPASEGFGMPAEWDAHTRTWMCWPSRLEAFGNQERFLRAKQAYARVARAIAAFEPVSMVACAEDAAEAKLATGGKAEIVDMAIDDSWARDTGPTFLKDGKGRLAGVKWRFNAWGEKYHPYTNDAALAGRILTRQNVQAYEAPLTCEGGALHSNGHRTILTTEQCLLNPNRNPDLSRGEIEACLRDYLGAQKIIWLGGVFSDDETDGHIDNIACFIAHARVLVGIPPKDHLDWEPVQGALRVLRAAHVQNGDRIEIVELPQPAKTRNAWTGKLMAASYVNFYLAKGAVIMPAFDDAHDEEARSILTDCFPDRDIMQIDALDIVEGGGGIHCITQQEPLP